MRAYFTMTLLSIVGLFVGAIFVQNASARVWTSGKYTVDAEYIGSENGIVRLRTRDGAEVVIQREKLSTSDIEFIEREFEQSPFKVVKPAPAPTMIPAVLSAKSSSTPAQKNLDLSSAGVKAGDDWFESLTVWNSHSAGFLQVNSSWGRRIPSRVGNGMKCGTK